MQLARPATACTWSLPDYLGPHRHAGYERCITSETVRILCQQGQLAEAVHALGVLVQADCPVTTSLFSTVLKRSVDKKDLVLGRRVHALAVKEGYESDSFLCNHILRMYSSHGRLQEAVDLFSVMPKPDAFTWSSIMSAHVKHGQAKQAIQLYHRMRKSGVKPDGHVFVVALQACAREADLESGQQVHADVLACGVEPDLFVCNCLVDMYGKCGNLGQAQRVFDGLGRKDVVTWTSLITGYSQQGMGREALRLYFDMQNEGLAVPDSVTFVCLLQACASVGTSALEKGRLLHAQIRERGLEADDTVGNNLINMYAKCGSIEDGHSVFAGLSRKDVVSWTALIAGYSQLDMGQEALDLHSCMQQEGMAAPDSVTFVCLMHACASVGPSALEKGKELHAQIGERGLQEDVVVGCSLVNMYAKCGSLEDAQDVFDGLAQKNVVTWNAMIAAYSQQCMGEGALRLYSAMLEEGILAPTAVTFVCLLQACANVAALQLGRQVHAQIGEQGLQADVIVGNSLINMYAKSGSMVDAQQVFDALPERNVVTWNALSAGYTQVGDSEVVFNLVCKMTEDGILPDDITFLSVLKVCSHAGLVNKGWEYFESMSKQYGIAPTSEHYSCMVDLLGRAGQLDGALELVRTMPVQPQDAVWHTLLGACQKWSNVEVGRHAFLEALKLDERDASAYVAMSNIYSGAQMWEEAQEIQVHRKRIGAWKQPGQSWWTDMDGGVHTFVVGNTQHPKSESIYGRLKELEPRLEKAWLGPIGHS